MVCVLFGVVEVIPAQREEDICAVFDLIVPAVAMLLLGRGAFVV